MTVKVPESSTRISKFYDPTNSEHKSHKTRMENGYSKVLNWDPPD